MAENRAWPMAEMPCRRSVDPEIVACMQVYIGAESGRRRMFCFPILVDEVHELACDVGTDLGGLRGRQKQAHSEHMMRLLGRA